jgi:hypothetical protein
MTKHQPKPKGKTMKNFDEMTLTQDAHPSKGSFPVGNGMAMYNGSWYEAHAKDGDGNEYMVRWTNVDWDAEDGADACDWDNPDYIQEL